MTDHGDDDETWNRRRLGITLRSGGNGSYGDLPHMGIHNETTGNHIGKGGLRPHI